MTGSEDTATRLHRFLGLDTFPVAVFLLRHMEDPFACWSRAGGHRYCQGIMRARRGESLLFEPGDLSCPAAARAFGFRPLPESLANGRGLVGFGIVREPETGRAMFEGMRYLEMNALEGVALCPLQAAPRLPEVVVVEGAPEQLMWLLLADLNLAGGKRRQGSTAVLQATCVDATLIPHQEDRLNFSLGCYGCRDATDLAPTETVVGFPGRMLEALTDQVGFLAGKAMPNSRAKNAWKLLEGK